MSGDFVVLPEMVTAVECWRSIPPRERIGLPLIPELRARFGVTARQAIAIIDATDAHRRKGHDHVRMSA